MQYAVPDPKLLMTQLHQCKDTRNLAEVVVQHFQILEGLGQHLFIDF